MNERAKATTYLQQIISKNRSLSSLKFNSALVQELVYGAIRYYPRLEKIVKAALFSPLSKKNQDLFYLMVIGIYQLDYMRIPNHAVVSETVDAVNRLKKPWAKSLVNKILRRFIAEHAFFMNIADQSLVGKYAHPEWLIKAIKKSWPEHWEAILVANNEKPPLTLRINHQRISTDGYIQLLKNHHVKVKKLPSQSETIILEKAVPVSQIIGFNQGLCSVQDSAGQHVAHLLALSNFEDVLDACAAPGSKTTHILEKHPNIQKLVVMDIQRPRLQLIEENLQRLQLNQSQVQLICADASNPDTWDTDSQFDVILIDAPCSSSGVIRRHPDIKILRKADDIAQYAEIQLALLGALWLRLRDNGRILYTTCSILPEENENVIHEFLRQQPLATITTLDRIPDALKLEYGQQLLPQFTHDGFYYCSLRKNSADTEHYFPE